METITRECSINETLLTPAEMRVLLNAYDGKTLGGNGKGAKIPIANLVRKKLLTEEIHPKLTSLGLTTLISSLNPVNLIENAQRQKLAS